MSHGPSGPPAAGGAGAGVMAVAAQRAVMPEAGGPGVTGVSEVRAQALAPTIGSNATVQETLILIESNRPFAARSPCGGGPRAQSRYHTRACPAHPLLGV